MSITVIVCGSRYATNPDPVNAALDQLHARSGITLLRHGAARGVDTLAAAWAARNNVPTRAYPADWDTHGRAAGPLRNTEMARDGADLLLAFPGGKGTANMVATARRHDIAVLEVQP